MVKLWMQWCRLCAREDTFNSHVNVLLNNEDDGQELIDTINSVFSVDMRSNNFPTLVCIECHNHIRTTIHLKDRLHKVTALFKELLEKSEEVDLSKVRAFHSLEVDFTVISPDDVEFKAECNELSVVAEQMIDPEIVHYNSANESNPINIKTEEEQGNSSRLDFQYDENTDDSDSPLGNLEHKQKSPKKRKKYKSRKERAAENKAKPHYCLECRKGFMKANNYRRHMESVHDVIIEVKLPVYICESCAKEFKSLSALKEHERSHTEERTHKCNYCEKTFKGIPSLKLHEDTHNKTNYICVVCGLQLNTQRTLRMHMVVHSDQKNHKCDFCGNEYKRAKALKNHLILHAGLRPYSCDFCDKTFADAANCRSHKKKNHPIQLAAQEAEGKKRTTVANIPKLKELKAVTANKNYDQPTTNKTTGDKPTDLQNVNSEEKTSEKLIPQDHANVFQNMFRSLPPS